MADVQKFVEMIAAEAVQARADGDTDKLNRLGAHPALQAYLDNVVFLASMDKDQFVYWYPSNWKAIQHLAEQYEDAEAAAAKTAALEAELGEVKALLKKLIEVQTPKQRAALAEDDTPNGGEPQAAEADAEPETPAEDTDSEEVGETDADTGEDTD